MSAVHHQGLLPSASPPQSSQVRLSQSEPPPDGWLSHAPDGQTGWNTLVTNWSCDDEVSGLQTGGDSLWKLSGLNLAEDTEGHSNSQDSGLWSKLGEYGVFEKPLVFISQDNGGWICGTLYLDTSRAAFTHSVWHCSTRWINHGDEAKEAELLSGKVHIITVEGIPSRKLRRRECRVAEACKRRWVSEADRLRHIPPSVL